jgi:hypothetical protein
LQYVSIERNNQNELQDAFTGKQSSKNELQHDFSKGNNPNEIQHAFTGKQSSKNELQHDFSREIIQTKCGTLLQASNHPKTSCNTIF